MSRQSLITLSASTSPAGSHLPRRSLSKLETPITTGTDYSLMCRQTTPQIRRVSQTTNENTTTTTTTTSNNNYNNNTTSSSSSIATNSPLDLLSKPKALPIITTPIDPADPLLVRWALCVEGSFIRALDASRLGWRAIDFARVGTHEHWWMNPIRVVVEIPGSTMTAAAPAVESGGGESVGAVPVSEGQEQGQRQRQEQEQEERVEKARQLERQLVGVALMGLQGAWAVWQGVLGEEGDGDGEGRRVEDCGLYRIEVHVRGEEDGEEAQAPVALSRE